MTLPGGVAFDAVEHVAADRAALMRQLVTARIAGAVRTPRESNVANARSCAEGDPDYSFGLDLGGRWTYPQVIALMAERVGIDPDPAYVEGPDTIDPERLLDAADRAAAQLALVAGTRGSVLLATGHPAGLLGVYQAIGTALAARGCTVLTPGSGVAVEGWRRPAEVRYVGGVAMLSIGGELRHTHLPTPMQVMLGALEGARPDLVVADHGFAGAAGQAGLCTVGFADCNDPALFVGEAEGRLAAVVPLDDNVLPDLYLPVTDWLLAGLPPRA